MITLESIECAHFLFGSSMAPSPYSALIADLVAGKDNLTDPSIRAELYGEVQGLEAFAESETDPSAAAFAHDAQALLAAFTAFEQNPQDPTLLKNVQDGIGQLSQDTIPPIPPIPKEGYKNPMYAFLMDKLMPLVETTPIPVNSGPFFAEMQGMMKVLSTFADSMGQPFINDVSIAASYLASYSSLGDRADQLNLIFALANLGSDLNTPS